MYDSLFSPLFFDHLRQPRAKMLTLMAILLGPMAVIPSTLAQHDMMHGAGGMSHSAGITAETEPMDDAVLTGAPQRLSLSFDETVRLVKLTLRTPAREMIDINFRYDPRPNEHFMHPLPELASADYYIADWAIINEHERLIHGSIRFSFGPDAQPPSAIMEEIEHMPHMMMPDYRVQDPEAEFIIR